ncbi:MAG: PLP-dependent aminotransferase family protein [Actinomycetota bacterium]|nr:PLP-dependent aminotransferase family protein [Actinomycetota bacterium]
MTRTATPVNFTLDLHRRDGPKASQVSHALIGAIAGGQIHDGDRLPSTRTLAASFRLPRSVVVSAYEELAAAGFLVARPGGSTFVEQGAGAASRAGAFGAPLRPAARQPQRSARRIAYDLRPGLADARLISGRDWARALRSAASASVEPDDVADPADGLASRTVHTQHADLRRQLTGHLRRARGLAVEADDIFLFPSVTLALAAVVTACDLGGKQVGFEDPGYPKARVALASAGARIRPAPVDEDGIRAQDLRASDLAVYVTPAHQFPLGGRMPVHCRAALLDWAATHHALVLEDDYDGEFRYDVPPLRPLRSMATGSDHVVYFGTSSKVLSRALRVSWAVLPARFRAAMNEHLDRSGDVVSEVSTAVLSSYLSTGALTRHQARAMRTYRARQARFITACQEYIPGVDALGIQAGLHVVLAFDCRLDDIAVAARLAASGLACSPLSAYYANRDSARRTGLVCGYSRLPETKARAAARLIARVIVDLSADQITG